METLLRLEETGSIYSQEEASILSARHIDDQDRARFTEIFETAATSGAFNNPVGYIQSLSSEDIGVLQRIHSFAEPSGTSPSDIEGAVNLLLPPKTVVDLNNDELVGRGQATSLQFPPPNAPQAVKDAWQGTVVGLDLQERMNAEMPFFVEMATANIQLDNEGRFLGMTQPGSPDYKNPFPSSIDQWLSFVN